MDGIDKLLPTLPSWISIPIIVTSLALTLGPKIYELFSQFTSRSRAVKREKDRLDLLKLRYEIEALRKEKNLDLIADPLFAEAPQRLLRDYGVEAPSTGELLSRWKRFLYGALGASVPSLVRLVFSLSEMRLNVVSISAGYFLGVGILAGLGGLVSSFIPKRQVNAFVCFLVGLSITLLLTAIVQEASQYQQRPPVPHSEDSHLTG